jgi:DNA-binding response OmpR family regulator
MRVLVIEDYAPLREAVSQGLREADIAVDTARNGEEGLWRAKASEYDVIVLDLMLPKVDGLTILKELRGAGNHTHVLILTAKDALEDRIQGLNAGADDYLVKPFAFGELLARIRALIRRKYDVKDPIIRVCDLTIDTTAHTVTRGGEKIDLTAREYALLEFLAMRAGQIVTRGHLWEHVYDFRSEATSNVVDVYVGYLRKKLERPGLPRLIHTRRGLGYVLEDRS